MIDTTTPDEEPLVVVSHGDLPEFEGRTPVGVLTSLQGAGQRIVRSLHLDERVVLVVEAKVADVRHPMTADGMKRSHVLKVEDLYELPGRRGQRLLTGLKQAWRLADDQRHGRTALEGLEVVDGVELTTDGSGVVLTPEELDELGLADAGNDPLVAVLDGGQRTIWPDDYPVGAAKPEAGDVVPVPGGEGEAQVVELLDPVTGETVAVWSEEDEEARLLEAERAAEAAEADEADEAPTEGQLVNRQPWPGYDDAKAGDVVQRVQASDDLGLVEHVVAYEEAHKGRTTVLSVARVVADELAAGGQEA